MYVGDSAVHEVCRIRNQEIAELVLSYSRNIAVLNGQGDQGIHIAALSGNTSVLNLLINKGCSSNRKVFHIQFYTKVPMYHT